MGRILAIDYGKKRTGLAVTDPLRIIATPLDTVLTNDLLSYLAAYVKKETVDEFVVGIGRARLLGYRVMLMIVGNPEAHDRAFEELLPQGVEVYRMDEDWRLREIATGRDYY